jgi:hypothetical protein
MNPFFVYALAKWRTSKELKNPGGEKDFSAKRMCGEEIGERIAIRFREIDPSRFLRAGKNLYARPPAHPFSPV